MRWCKLWLYTDKSYYDKRRPYCCGYEQHHRRLTLTVTAVTGQPLHVISCLLPLSFGMAWRARQARKLPPSLASPLTC